MKKCASNLQVTVADGYGVVITVDVLDVNKGSSVNHLLTRKDLVAGKLVVPFLVTSLFVKLQY